MKKTYANENLEPVEQTSEKLEANDRANKRIESFFAAYQQRFEQSLEGKQDVEGQANAFAKFFVEASPAGVNGGANDDKFRKMIPQGMAFYKKIGTTAMKVSSIKTTRLDELHYMARVHWQSFYNNKDGDEVIIEFDVIYLLQDLNKELKIFAYITGDEQGILREHGLID